MAYTNTHTHTPADVNIQTGDNCHFFLSAASPGMVCFMDSVLRKKQHALVIPKLMKCKLRQLSTGVAGNPFNISTTYLQPIIYSFSPAASRILVNVLSVITLTMSGSQARRGTNYNLTESLCNSF